MVQELVMRGTKEETKKYLVKENLEAEVLNSFLTKFRSMYCKV